MTGAQATLAVGREQLWASTLFHTNLVSATPLRVLWLLCACAVAWIVRDRRDIEVLLGALGIVMLARLLCEPTIFSYYLGPAFAFAIMCAALQRKQLLPRVLLAATLQLWCAFHHGPETLWWLGLAAGSAYICAPLFAALRAAPATSVPESRVAVPSAS
jgi:hypothetical protein